MYQILIAEDELIERRVLKKTIVRCFGEECQVLDACNGREAIKLFNENTVHIAILDIEMPVIKGIDVAEEIYRRNKNCCIIFLTAYDKFEYAKRAIGVRAMEYLLKPYSEKELISVVCEALRRVQEISNTAGNAFEAIKVTTEVEVEEKAGNKCAVMAELVEEYICRNYMRDISMQDVARKLNYSEPYFCKFFKLQYGINFTTYLTEYRIEEAKKLLRGLSVSVKEAGEMVGYADAAYFTRVFKRIVGISPSEYRLQKME